MGTAAAGTVVGKGTAVVAAGDKSVGMGTGALDMAEDKGTAAAVGDKSADMGMGALGKAGDTGMGAVVEDKFGDMGTGALGKAEGRGTAAVLEAVERLLAKNQTKNIKLAKPRFKGELQSSQNSFSAIVESQMNRM